MTETGSMKRMLWRTVLVIALATTFIVTGCTEPESPETTREPGTVVAIGDSIMVAASEHFAGVVEDIVVDAEVGRPFSDGIDALERRLAGGETPDTLVVALGTNAGTSAAQIDELMELADGVDEVIFVTVRVPRDWESSTNRALAEAANRHPTVRIVDWHAASVDSGHLFRSDGYHLNDTGSELWANLILIEIKS